MRIFSLLPTFLFLRTAATVAVSVPPPPPPAPAVLGPSATLPISNAVISPDGVSRSAVLAGGTFPGSLIAASTNSQFQINVQDQLKDKSMNTATSIHWHGLRQMGTAWSDGVAFVSQCPITPGNSFTYQFNANGQAGTYWYHSHYSNQYCDGLRGPLVIYDPNDPFKKLYDVDNAETVVTLADWYHESSLVHAPTQYPDSTLINGLGRTWANTKNTTLALGVVNRNTRYRLRLVSLSCEPAYTFSIDQHVLTIIEVDGVNHQPLAVDGLTIYAGQRYSVILNANQPVNNYWVRALPVDDGLSFPNGPFANGINSAILRYAGAPIKEPTTPYVASKNPLVESKLIPYTNQAAPGGASLTAPGVTAFNLNFALDASFQFELNGSPRQLPSVPVMLQIMSGAQTAQSLLPSNQYFSLPKNTVVQLSFPGSSPAPTTRHPIHLHGHQFSVIRSAGQSNYNFNNPPRRDVVNMGGPGDNVTIRFTTDNSGPWFLHCHVDWHLAAGFSAVFVEDTPANIKANNHPSAQWNNLCKAWDSFSASGRV